MHTCGTSKQFHEQNDFVACYLPCKLLIYYREFIIIKWEGSIIRLLTVRTTATLSTLSNCKVETSDESSACSTSLFTDAVLFPGISSKIKSPEAQQENELDNITRFDCMQSFVF